jgi:hypothetical protein
MKIEIEDLTEDIEDPAARLTISLLVRQLDLLNEKIKILENKQHEKYLPQH